MEKNIINDTPNMVEKALNKKIFEKLKSWSWFAIILSVILFLLMCKKGELYTELWKDELYTSLGIIVPLSVFLPVVEKLVLMMGKIERVKIPVEVIQFLAGICVFIGYVIIWVNTGGHETDGEFYARRFLAIWFMLDFMVGFFMHRAIREDI